MMGLTRLIYPQAWFGGPGKAVYLSFDDGPDPDISLAIAEGLRQRAMPATFFCLGEALAKQPRHAEQLIQMGHAIGYHGYKHLDGFRTKNKRYLANFVKPEAFPSQLLRPPYGRIWPSQYKQLSKFWQMVFWSGMPGDFRAHQSVLQLQQRLGSMLHEGALIVLHDRGSAGKKCLESLNALEDLLAQRGLEAKALPMKPMEAK